MGNEVCFSYTLEKIALSKTSCFTTSNSLHSYTAYDLRPLIIIHTYAWLFSYFVKYLWPNQHVTGSRDYVTGALLGTRQSGRATAYGPDISLRFWQNLRQS